MLVLFYILYSLYIAFLLFAIYTWKTKSETKIDSEKLISVSIIIAARNEENKIPLLLQSLDCQNYPRSLIEVIIVNDHSTDKTAELVESYKTTSSLVIRLLNSAHESSTPKKDALKLGIENSHSDVLLFTDADCTMLRKWVSEMVAPFQNPDIHLTIGSIKYEAGNFLEKLLSQEQAALLGSAFASLKMGIPTMCNGANMAIRKSAYKEINGFYTPKISASGDDELLLHKVFSKDKNSVRFVLSKDAIVTTEVASTTQKLFQQRKRWAGKWEKYLLHSTKAFAFFIFLFHCAWLSFSLFVLFNQEYWFEFGCFILAKLILEFVFIHSVMKFLDKRINLLGFSVLQLIYSPYVVFFGLISRSKKYSWKGRELN